MAQRTPLAKLLLARIDDVPGSPLFNSQVEMASIILELAAGSDYSAEPTLRSFINQVLMGRRRCNEKLTKYIINAVSKKVQKKHQAKVQEKIIEAINYHNDFTVPKYFAANPSEKPMGEILEIMAQKQQEAESVFIINMYPLEVVDESKDKKAEKITKETLEALFASKPHTFCVPDTATAIRLWKAFYREILVSQGNPDKADKKLLELENAGVLTIHAIPLRDCVHSTVVYNASSPNTRSGWIWYVPFKPHEIAEMPAQVLEHWIREFFNPIESEQLIGQERVKWSEVRKTHLR